MLLIEANNEINFEFRKITMENIYSLQWYLIPGTERKRIVNK